MLMMIIHMTYMKIIFFPLLFLLLHNKVEPTFISDVICTHSPKNISDRFCSFFFFFLNPLYFHPSNMTELELTLEVTQTRSICSLSHFISSCQKVINWFALLLLLFCWCCLIYVYFFIYEKGRNVEASRNWARKKVLQWIFCEQANLFSFMNLLQLQWWRVTRWRYFFNFLINLKI